MKYELKNFKTKCVPTQEKTLEKSYKYNVLNKHWHFGYQIFSKIYLYLLFVSTLLVKAKILTLLNISPYIVLCKFVLI